MVRYHICVPNLNTGKCRCRTRDEFWCEICRQFIGLNRQHQAAHCASHSFNMESLQMKVLACVVKNIDARRKRRIQRVACVSPPASDVLRLILLHVIRLDFWVLMFLFYWFNFLKWKYNFFFFFFLPVIWLFWEKGPFESAAVTRSDNLTTLQHSVWQLSPRHTAAFWDWFSPPAVWWKKKKEKKKKGKALSASRGLTSPGRVLILQLRFLPDSRW